MMLTRVLELSLASGLGSDLVPGRTESRLPSRCLTCRRRWRALDLARQHGSGDRRRRWSAELALRLMLALVG